MITKKFKSFNIPGEPVGKGRPRFTRSGHVYTPPKTLEYETLTRMKYFEHYGDEASTYEGPVRVKIKCFFQIPKSESKRRRHEMAGSPCLKKPDADNIGKIILDALNGAAFSDDKQIVSLTVEKVYTPEDPGVHVDLIYG